MLFYLTITIRKTFISDNYSYNYLKLGTYESAVCIRIESFQLQQNNYKWSKTMCGTTYSSLQSSNTLNYQRMITHRAIASLYTVPLSAVNGLSCLTVQCMLYFVMRRPACWSWFFELYCTCRLLRFVNDCNKEDYYYYYLWAKEQAQLIWFLNFQIGQSLSNRIGWPMESERQTGILSFILSHD